MSYAAHPKRRNERASEIAVWFLLKVDSCAVKLAAARRVGAAVVARQITLDEADHLALQARYLIARGSKVPPTQIVLGLLNGLLRFRTVANTPAAEGGAL